MEKKEVKNTVNISVVDSRTRKFIIGLELSSRSQVSHVIDLLEKYGNHLGPPHNKKLTRNIFELRTIGGIAVRLFYAFHKGEVIILHGYIKKTQKTPRRELETAERKLKLLHLT